MLSWCSGRRPKKSDERKNPEEKRRLGIFELGPYAYEERMPASLAALLSSPEQAAGEEASPASIPLLQRLSAADPNVATAYFCNTQVQHISKVRGEGNHFCAYRNIQMQASYIRHAFSSPPEVLEVIPSVSTTQSLIEAAWDRGFNANGRFQTGGIKDTRKHIGTQEAQALLTSLGLRCKVKAFRGIQDGKRAHERLLEFVHNLHSSQDAAFPTPIFLQRPHHSLTIIGIEVLNTGARQLLVFDPAFPPSTNFLDCLSSGAEPKNVFELLKPYRRTEKQMSKYSGFEILFVTH